MYPIGEHIYFLDKTPADIKRTRFMYLLAGIPHLTTLLAPPLSGALMRLQIWLPFVVAITALALSLVLLFLMPESLNHESTVKSPLLGPADTINGPDNDGNSQPTSQQSSREIHDRVSAASPQTKEWWRDIWVLIQMPGLPFCYILFFFKPMAMISKAYVYQYASYNFHWGLSQTTWLRFSQAGGSSIATAIVLPLLSSVLNRRGFKAQHLDLNVIRFSLFVAVVGFLFIQFSSYGWMLLLCKRFELFAIVELQLTTL